MKAEALEVQKYLTDKKDDLALQLDSLVDGYWIAWRDRNRKIIAQSANSDLNAKVGKVAPSIRIYKTKNHNRITLRWRVYDNSWARLNVAKSNKQTLRYANELKRNKDGTTSRFQLVKNAESWEVEFIDKFLSEAEPIITLINIIHQSIKLLNNSKALEAKELEHGEENK
ncbi:MULTISPECIES: hypothetical protein [Pseudoalteromonas]|uniref:Uncharacterized protein n=1 Tax=Pseudoalteromonas arctica A 37-1-2 TaxID=1117313 RepID=A0A290SA80_9GAMM|nr:MULTISPECIES: hypothetical protein [Pseudoalteromonas]OUX96055.1 MAG: hypothetical protein CBC03_00215 [Pseudoalteromonas sp. TMED43]ATC88996.1 hypothetical protein PARC_p0019 [Pseudoalteromonas arctica A 37-1-2]MDC9567058.1 hypothetical protein [Pseudoalteromonas sp. GAB2316C]MDC9571286.1 hypothetical protein [Pseudoalteromonas sp. GABNB9D]MDC9575528.1 hypothetical protein [Pseudoalteromonas sp. GABNS16A]|tara:strand:- start:2346 stop:2855 length:510 start_codon:yes stop_codon:yes gene_type:complete